ncbi:hypothetical protein HD806DRAFT_533644 [Xylariaceae sp. AK1471]|nr:hypothetical protein HD806DRAFT_533644 [Xylariaceae sp. AK1471]
MGRLEPLTSLALGRSPYDDVVEGEGETDPHEPSREFDEHGRIVNDETKRINKDIIRAHNEVMLVIGVAEPDNAGVNSFVAEASRLHHEFENATGKHFLRMGRLLVVAGIWGVHGVRQRILVYKETARFPFIEMMQRETRTHSASQLLFAGMPSFFSAWSLQWSSRSSAVIRNSLCLRAIISYIRFHLQIYVAMQRLDLIPGSRWFPSLNFFIPFSSSSPFIAPPPLGSSDARSLSEWAGKVAMSLIPYAGYYLIGCAWDVSSYFIRRQIHKSLPHPWPSSTTNLRSLLATSTPRRQSIPESPTLGEADREIRHPQGPEIDPAGPLAVNGDGVGEPLPIGTIRRQGTFSSRGGEDYATDEEDSEVVNPTLISFDVDTSESTEPPTGIWSAELRPSNSGDSRPQQKEAPKYVVNTLTSLPALLAGDILTSSLTHILLTPFDILAFRGMARAFAFKFGLPLGRMFEASLADGLSTRMILNLFQAEVLKFITSCEVWAIITVVAQRFHVTDEEWKEYHLEMERELEEEEQAETAAAAQPS